MWSVKKDHIEIHTKENLCIKEKMEMKKKSTRSDTRIKIEIGR